MNAAPRKPRATAKPKAPADTSEQPVRAEADATDERNVQLSRTDKDRAFVTSNRFSVAQVEVRGRELVAIAPTNHVGPAPLLIPLHELGELIEVLQTLADAPGPVYPED